MVVLAPVPVIAPVLMVQLPEGRPFRTTLPVAVEQVGCVIEPNVGAPGVAGWVLMTIFADANEIHPTELVTV